MSQKCKYHCRCMNLNGLCPNPHYRDKNCMCDASEDKPLNQCDGCQQGFLLRKNDSIDPRITFEYLHVGSKGKFVMYCTKSRYVAEEKCKGKCHSRNEPCEECAKDISSPISESWEKWVTILSKSKNPNDIVLLIAKIKVLLSLTRTEEKRKIETEINRLHMAGKDAYEILNSVVEYLIK